VQPCEEDRLEEEHGRVALRDALGCGCVQDGGGLLGPRGLEWVGIRFLEKNCVLEVLSEDGHGSGCIA